METRPPLPPFTRETAIQKVRLAEDGWNSRDAAKVATAYTLDTQWRNRAEFVNNRAEAQAFLERKWNKEHEYRLIKELWAFTGNRIAVRFAYEWHDDAALCVVMAAKGYPDAYRKGTVIGGLHEAGLVPDTITFHAGTALDTKGEVTAVGGRVLGMTGVGKTIKEAQQRAYRAVAQIDWKEGFCRKDIGYRAVGRGD